MRVRTWLRWTMPMVAGTVVGLGMALIQRDQAPQCLYPGHNCRVGFPHDCDFPPCPTHGPVHWLAVAVAAVVVAAIVALITIVATARRDG